MKQSLQAGLFEDVEANPAPAHTSDAQPHLFSQVNALENSAHTQHRAHEQLPAGCPSGTNRRGQTSQVHAATQAADVHQLAHALPSHLHLGTSSWHFPGWEGLVWEHAYAQTTLSKHGLRAYAQHPLLRSVSLDRGFYRPISSAQYAQYAAQVPADFRFVVKAPSLVCDALVRNENGYGMQSNPGFLNSQLATDTFIQPALEGLGSKIGALVFQISPLPRAWLAEMPALLTRLSTLLAALPSLQSLAPGAVIAVEVRDRAWLTPTFAQVLRQSGVTYCLGLHPRLPPIDEQLPLLRALWPGPLVCRWNLNRRHGAYGYEEAKGLYEPFNEMKDPDPETRATLARVAAGTLGAGQPAYICINNKAEGSAPLSVKALATEITKLQSRSSRD